MLTLVENDILHVILVLKVPGIFNFEIFTWRRRPFWILGSRTNFPWGDIGKLLIFCRFGSILKLKGIKMTITFFLRFG